MTAIKPQTCQNPFEYHYFSPRKNIHIRYGDMNAQKAPEKAVFLLLHGRSEFIEKYTAIANRLQSKGFRVISPDWRGQGLSTRQTDNRQKGHINSFGDYVEDLAALYSKIIAPLELPVYILSHSMGGHIALRFMSEYPLSIKKAVLASPMIDIALPGLVYPLAKFISKRLSSTPFAEKYTIGSKDYSLKTADFKGNKLSHDPFKHAIFHDEIKKNPDLAIGGVTWGWLNAAFESIEMLKKNKIIHRIESRILILSAQKDAIVSRRAQKRIGRRLPDCEFHSIHGAFHELMFEEPRILNIFWALFDRFMGV